MVAVTTGLESSYGDNGTGTAGNVNFSFKGRMDPNTITSQTAEVVFEYRSIPFNAYMTATPELN